MKQRVNLCCPNLSNYVKSNIMLFNTTCSLLLCLIFFASFGLELLLIAIVDRIGVEEKHLTHQKMVPRTYAVMGVAAALGFGTMGFFTHVLIDLLGVVLLSLSAALWLVHKRSVLYHSNYCKRGITARTRPLRADLRHDLF